MVRKMSVKSLKNTLLSERHKYMIIEKEKIQEAKLKVGTDKTWEIMKRAFGLANADDKNHKACCPFHNEKTPSFILNEKTGVSHCFGCNRSADIIDAYMHEGKTYMQALEELFKEAKMKVSFGELGVKTERDYKYPHVDDCGSKDIIYDYLAKRKISKETVDKAGLTQDSKGNIVFNYYDTNDVLCMCKYRPSHKIDKSKGEIKNWCQAGADTMPLLFNMNKVNVDLPLVCCEGECVSNETEILTPNGWVRIDEYNNEKVLQIHPDMTGSFVTPIAYVKHEYDGDMYTEDKKGYSISVTANHNMVYFDYKGRLQKTKACEMKCGSSSSVPTAVGVNGSGIPLTNDELALWIAVSADCYCDGKKYILHCKKQRKIDRLSDILNRLAIEFVVRQRPDTTFDVKFLKPSFITSKIFPMEWIGLATLEQRKFIIEEMVYWDGNTVPNRAQYEYSSKEYSNATFMQTIAHTCGYHSSIIRRSNAHGSWYKVSILLKKNHVSHQKPYNVEKYKGMVYCVTVPTGMILVRHHEHISVTGNCDTLAAIEAGFPNAVSVPFGSQNTHWIEKNWDWLEQFSSIIICSDNDEAGVKMRKEVIPRLGAWRTKYIDIPKFHHDEATGKDYPMKDLNEVLFYEGKEGVRKLFDSACDPGVPSVKNVSEIHDMDLDEVDGIMTGISDIDRELMRLFYGTLTVVSGKPGCVDKDTEYFNGQEWKKISEFTVGEKVLQYKPDGTAELVVPSRYIKVPCDKFYHLKTEHGIDQMLSGEHNVVYVSSKGNIVEKSMEQVYHMHQESKNGFTGKFITSFDYSGNGVDISDEEIRLMCAVIADGSFSADVSENAPSYRNCRINIKKQRKKERLEKLLVGCGIDYKVRQYNPRDLEFSSYVFPAPIRTKKFPCEWYGFNKHQREVFIDEVLRWDGHVDKIGRMSFSSVDKHNIDFVQYMFAASGYATSIHVDDRVGKSYKNGYVRKSVCYDVCVTNRHGAYRSYHRRGEKHGIPVESSQDGFKYCFTVPSHMLVLRRNGNIFITGNSGKTSFLSQVLCSAMDEGKPVWMFSREMPDWMQKNWFNYILAGGHHIETKTTSTGTEYYKVAAGAKEKIDKYYDNRWFLYRDEWSNKFEDVLVSMEDSVRKYGAKLLIIDNLMMLDLGGSDDSKLEKQTECITSLIKFAMKYSVAVVLVAHPRKTPAGEELNMYDVAGSSNIINLAHRTLGLRRINQDKEHSAYNVKVTILKDRLRGMANKEINMYYDMGSRRFYTNEAEYNHQYGWDDGHYEALPYPHNEEDEVFGKDE